MSIPVEIESEAFQKELPEMCVFCGGVGRHWHKATNTPMCLVCVDCHDEEEIEGAKYPVKTIAPW
jgi:hypothetical protein